MNELLLSDMGGWVGGWVDGVGGWVGGLPRRTRGSWGTRPPHTGRWPGSLLRLGPSSWLRRAWVWVGRWVGGSVGGLGGRDVGGWNDVLDVWVGWVGGCS